MCSTCFWSWRLTVRERDRIYHVILFPSRINQWCLYSSSVILHYFVIFFFPVFGYKELDLKVNSSCCSCYPFSFPSSCCFSNSLLASLWLIGWSNLSKERSFIAGYTNEGTRKIFNSSFLPLKIYPRIVWEIFKKLNIHSHKNFICWRMESLVPFLCRRVA